jgi:hypothetical protein
MGQADPRKYKMLKCVIFGLYSFFLTKGTIVRDLVITTLLIAEGAHLSSSRGGATGYLRFGNS